MRAPFSRRVVCLPALLVVAACGGGGDRPRVDQAQADIDLEAPYNLSVGDTSRQRLAQVVTAGASGVLLGFRMPVFTTTSRVTRCWPSTTRPRSGRAPRSPS